MSAGDSEIDRIDPEFVEVKLSTGYSVGVQRLKTRQFFRLLRVLTRGVGPVMLQTQLDFRAEPNEFGQRLLALVFMAIPEAEQQFIEFLQSMCLPLDLNEAAPGRRLSNIEVEENQAALTEMLDELNNPELEDLMELGEAIIRREAPEIQALAKKVRRWMEMAEKAGVLKQQPKTEEKKTSPARSRRRSISSATSTDGPTSTFSASRSAGSGNASRPPSAARDTSTGND